MIRGDIDLFIWVTFQSKVSGLHLSLRLLMSARTDRTVEMTVVPQLVALTVTWTLCD